MRNLVEAEILIFIIRYKFKLSLKDVLKKTRALETMNILYEVLPEHKCN